MEIDKDKLKNFLNSVKDKTNITAQELIEKDFYLNILLSKINFEEYVFKGGTCLAKAYLDYFRFSEDLDFTFINQKLWEGKSTKSIKKICKEKIDSLGEQLKNGGFDFKFDKADRNFVEIGNNNKLVTFKVYYDSVLTGKPSFIKIQIKPQNFLKETKEKLMYSINSYEKYKDNFILARDKLQTLEFQYSEVRLLVIKPFNKEDFDA